ncbi:hypothetical protein F0562_030793 [Nyssa sinensis]|uniref:HMA domain-containing protein n=1 Tax=Nyssa sinensis TaxID=561372 RepID=A0A5J5AXR8_9ASTE|nr:hypothetical protein F0562_030793 [Nyssa sinensis]
MTGNDRNEATKKLQKSYFDVLGLCCSSEVPLIEKILKNLDGVKDVSVIVPSKTVIVVHDNLHISQVQIVKALNQARLEANVRVYGEGNYKKKWPSPYAVACGILLVLSFLKYVYRPFQWLAIGSVAIGICPILLRGAAAIRNLTLDVNILVIIAVVGSIVLNDYWEAASIVFLFTIAEWLESRASHKATAVMSSLVNIVPQRAILAETGEEVDADAVNVNTILAVKAGEIIPIDGIVVDGECEVDEKTLTGESFPVAKQKESTVLAGTINLNGYISVKTTALAEDCVVARMAKLVEEAQNKKSKTQRIIDKCAKYYTPAIVFISTCLAVIPAALRVHNQNQWFHLALVVLVSACPCALVLSTPVATFCALSTAATSGLLIKGGEYLETLAKIKIMAFDKTGTITRGEFIVTDFQSLLDDVSLNTLLYWVSSIESKSSHPMAAALVEYGHLHSVDPKPDKVEEFQNFPGEGIYGKIDGKDIYVGNQKIAERAGCKTVPTFDGDAKEGKSIGYIFSSAATAGIFSLSDACRTGVKEAIEELKSIGIKTAMLTGDSNAAAMHAQHQLGGALDVVQAELLPEDKARIIKDFQKEAPTAMIGDGLNDAPALATADIGISMGISGSALATETGHVILMSNDIRKIPKAARLAQRTHRKVIENVILSIITKTAILALAFAGHPLVWAAVLADVGTCLLVIFNSMLLLGGTHKHGNKCCKSSAERIHKHGSKTDGSHSSHNHKHCCSHAEVQTTCNPSAAHVHNHGSNTDGSQSSQNHKHCCSHAEVQTTCNPSAAHVHKHGSNTDGSHSSHNHKNCCSHTEVQTTCASSAAHVHKHGSDSSHNHEHCCVSTEVQTTSCPSAAHMHTHGSNIGGSHSSHNHKQCRSHTELQTTCSSSAARVHKHGSNSDYSQSSQNHVHHCSYTEVQTCDTQKCSSQLCTPGYESGRLHSSSCGNNECSESGRCPSGDQLQEAKHSDHQTHDMVTQNKEHNYGHSGSCKEGNCRNLDERHNGCLVGPLLHEVKHCNIVNHNTMAHDIASQSGHNHMDINLLELGHHTMSNGHCHSIHCVHDQAKKHIADADISNMVELETNCEVHSECKKHGTDSGAPLHATNHWECNQACMSLEKIHIGGCCKSYRKECCNKSANFGANLGGGLSEIIIE